jgi:hypothetical protein
MAVLVIIFPFLQGSLDYPYLLLDSPILSYDIQSPSSNLSLFHPYIQVSITCFNS